MTRKIIIWIGAVVLTLTAAIYQRKTGPTYPVRIDIELGDSLWTGELIRTSGARDAQVKLPINNPDVSANLYYRKYKVDEEWSVVPFKLQEIRKHNFGKKNKAPKKNETSLAAYMPMQPPAGKLEYYIEVQGYGDDVVIAKQNPIVVRFKGDVPGKILIPHIILMFFAMLLATVAGLFAAFKIKSYKLYTWLTFFVLLIGGGLFGPWVQLYAFGDWWTGIPFGWDLTDNKTLIAFVFWILAIWKLRKKDRYGWVILAAVMTLVVFSIPHSMFGSELDYTTGTVTQG